VNEKVLLTRPLDLKVGQAVLWKCSENAFRRARVEEVHQDSIPLRVDITLIDIGRKIYFMKTDMLIKVENEWLISDKSNSADDSISAETKYVDLPAKAMMIDHESVENLPIDFNNENDTKFKIEVAGINLVNGWPIYNFELLEKYVNGEFVPVVEPEELPLPAAPARKKIKFEDKIVKMKAKVETSKMTEEEKRSAKIRKQEEKEFQKHEKAMNKPKVETSKMTEEEKRAAKIRKQEEKEVQKHEKAINKLMESILINFGNSIATPECSVFLEWHSDKTGDHVILEERVNPDVLPGYKHQSSFKISKELFMMILEVEDDIREYILQKKQTESWDSINLGGNNLKKMFINFDERGDARIVFRNFYFNMIHQEFMKAGISTRIALSESQFSMLIEAKAGIMMKFREALIDRQVEDSNRSKFFK
jgi:flagellar biosynthesis GTPase FlhF